MAILSRRAFIYSTVAISIPPPAFADDDIGNGKFQYRGFTVDASDAPNIAEIEASIKHQIDIAADSGVKPEILNFFQSQRIFLKSSGDRGGEFDARREGISVFAAVQAADNPVILHELLHAYHFRVLPERFNNLAILRFYNQAKFAGYEPGAYFLKNPQEFFAVTASLYLWGKVARPPFRPENLKSKQPEYYEWLAQLFGVER